MAIDTSTNPNLAPGSYGFYLTAGVPANGAVGTGTYAGIAPVGCLLIDTVNAELYINKGTQASVTWTKVSLE